MKIFSTFCIAAMLTVSCSTINKTAKYPNMVADIDPFSIGSVNASFDQVFSTKLKVDEINVIFYPRENEVALEFGMNLGRYRQFWNKEGRQLFIEALNRYKGDFENQKLANNFYRTRGAYGRFKGRFQWNPLSISTMSTTYRSIPVIDLGYRFSDNSPYFTANQNAAREESRSNKDITESPVFTIHFNRAQAEELTKLFDETFLLSSVKGKEPVQTIDSYRDEYPK